MPTSGSLYLIKPYFVHHRLRIIIGLTCLVVVDFLQLFIPRVVKWAVDDLTVGGATPQRLLAYGCYIVALAVFIGIFRYVWRRCLIGLSRRVEEGLRNQLFAHIQTLSADYFGGVKTGDLMARATNDVNHVRMAAGMGMVALTDAVVLGTAAVGFMLYISVKLTLFVLIPMPFIALSTRFFGRKMHRRYQQVQGAFSDLTESVRESLAGIRIVKAYTREAQSRAKVESISRDYITKNLRLVRVTRSFFPLMVLFSNFSMAIVLFLGGRLTILGTITPGDFVAFISYLGLLTWPMMALGWLTNLIQRGKASLDRIDGIMRTPPGITDGHQTRIPGDARAAAIQFEDVSFTYGAAPGNAGDSRALADIFIKLEAGRILGIVGPPGSGKSTLLQLIPRVYDATEGRVLLDGNDVRDLALETLRSRVRYMPQEPFLFAGTIRDNILMAQDSADNTALQAALAGAMLEDTVAGYPDGLDTVVGEKGVILSGGQKQRIALARCLLDTSPVLILDDPISQVDTETASAIIGTIQAMTASRTLLIASHRLSAVEFAHGIAVMENGRIIESGTHSELMASGGYYARTYRMQQLEEESDAR